MDGNFKYKILSSINVPDKFLCKWQGILDTIVEIISVPVALIMKVHEKEIEVFVKSSNKENVYYSGEKASLNTGLYCETVMSTERSLLVANALAEAEWKNNPDIALGMISYLGLPILWPTGEIFGTICVLDKKENTYSERFLKLLTQFRNILQDDLEIIRYDETRFYRLFETIPQAVVYQNKDGYITYANPAAEKILGYTLEQLQGKTSTSPEWKAIHEDGSDFPGDTHPSMIALKTGKEVKAVKMGLFKPIENRYIWINICAVPIFRTDETKPYEVYTTFEDITKEVQIEKDLINKEKEKSILSERLIVAQQIAKIGSWDWDLSNNKVWWSDETYSIFGVSKEDYIPSPETNAQFFHPEDRETFVKLLEKSTITGEPLEQDLRLLLNNNEIKYCYAKATITKDRNGKPLRFSGIIMDISERKRIEYALKMSEILHRTLLENLSIGYTLTSLDGKIISANIAAIKIFKYDNIQDFLNIPANKIYMHQEDRLEVIKEIEDKGFVSNKKIQLKCKDGSLIWISMNINVIEYVLNYEKLLVTTLSDITANKLAEEALIESEEKFKITFEHNITAMLLSELESDKIVDCNRQFCNFSGYKHEELIGHTISELNIWEDQNEKLTISNMFIQQKALQSFEYTLKQKSGKTIFMLLSAIPLKIKNKKYLLISGIDITERKNAENQIRFAMEEAERANNLKTQFLNNMSHELRTPLTAIIGFSELLNDLSLEPEIKEYPQIINKSGKHLLKLITEITELSKIETGNTDLNYEIFDLESLLTDINNIILYQLNSKSLRFSYTIDKSISKTVFSDYTRLQQVLINLLTNSIKFTDEGEISLEISSYSSTHIIFKVTDTGLGIPKDKLQMIFEPFEQVDKSLSRKLGGTGLGLAITKSIVKLLNGQIWVDSTEGIGSTFYFTIDISKKNNITTQTVIKNYSEAMGVNKPKSLNKHILIVEDAQANAKLIEAYLKSQSINLLTFVETGEEALAKIETGYLFDLVLMDIQLPGIDGLETTRKIKSIGGKWNDVPIIAITAYANKEDRLKILQGGCNEYISKPIDKQKFCQLINKYL